MKQTWTKIPAMAGMFISLICFGCLVAALILMQNEEPVTQGVSDSFALWIFNVILAMFSLVFYTIDAVLSIIKACMRIHPLFNAILALLLIGAIPMVIFVGGKPVFTYLWNVYYLGIFILETVSVAKHIRMNKKAHSVT